MSNIEFEKFYSVAEFRVLNWTGENMVSYIDLDGATHGPVKVRELPHMPASGISLLAVKFHKPLTQAEKLIAALGKDHRVPDSMRIVIKNFFGERTVGVWDTIYGLTGPLNPSDRLLMDEWINGNKGAVRKLPTNLREKLGNHVLALHMNQGGLSPQRDIVVTPWGMAMPLASVKSLYQTAKGCRGTFERNHDAAEIGIDYRRRTIAYNHRTQQFVIGCQTFTLKAVEELLMREKII